MKTYLLTLNGRRYKIKEILRDVMVLTDGKYEALCYWRTKKLVRRSQSTGRFVTDTIR